VGEGKMTGHSFEADVREFDTLLRKSRQYKLLYPQHSEAELASGIAKMLDQRNPRSPSTNGLLAIALVRMT
jgi:hypothetical protein